MQSKNPVFNRTEGFSARSGSGYPGQAYAGTGYADPGSPTHYEVGTGDRMTIDTVVQKTGMTLGIVVLVAAATWLLTPDLNIEPEQASQLYVIAMVGAFVGFGLAMVNSFKKVISPALVLAYAAFEGIFVGAFSKALEYTFADPDKGMGGLVIGAVLGTMAAVGGTLAAYKFFNIQVGTKFRKWVVGMMFGFVAISLLDFVLLMFGSGFGFNGFGAMGLISSVIGLALGVLMLILDFDFIERGIAAGLPERESWRAAFGLTVTIIWIYIEILRILAILRGSD